MIVTVDFETYYSTEYSLRRMSEVDYILSPLFQTIMCAIKINDAPTNVYVGQAAVAAAFAEIGTRYGWHKVALLSHNVRFDGAIAAWIYKVIPKMYLCTLSMARSLTHSAAGGSSLDKVSKYLGLPPKGHEVIHAQGKRLEDFGPDLVDYMAYCMRDNDNCYDIFMKFRQAFPTAELDVVDMTARMFIEPQVRLDTRELETHLIDVRTRREALFAEVSTIARDVFSSNAKFAKLLTDMGVEIPMKTSPATGLEMPALAKNDRGFRELCDDDNQPPEVQAVLAARIGAKSTLEETRTSKLLELSRHSWGAGRDTSWMPVPLKYYGARTGRFSGDGGFNFQNLKRGSPLRNAIKAPKGWRIVHRDASQIEARMVAWLARCDKLIGSFTEGRDIYSEFASKVYGRRVTKADVGGRFVGKTAILGLGYGMGPSRFRHTLFIGNGGTSLAVSAEEAARIVYLYRSEFPEIPNLWNIAEHLLYRMTRMAKPFTRGRWNDRDPAYHTPHRIRAIDWSAEALWLPNGMAIQYPQIRREGINKPDGSYVEETVYDDIGGRTKLFGGKTVENVSQALSRIIITDAATRIHHATGYNPFLSTHDSLDYCCPASDVEALDRVLEYEFQVRPAWGLGLPLASEGGWGESLIDAERGVNQ